MRAIGGMQESVRRGKPANERWTKRGRLERQEAPWSVSWWQWAKDRRESLGQWEARIEGAKSVRSEHLRKSKLERLGQAEARSLSPESPVGVSERSTEVRRKGEQEGGAMLATMGQPGI